MNWDITAPRQAGIRRPVRAVVRRDLLPTLWALGVFLGLGCLAPHTRTVRRAIVALAVSYGVEVSQLYHAPWIDELRHTTLGALILGFGFLWSDLACYTAGVALGALVDHAVRQYVGASSRAARGANAATSASEWRPN